MISGGFSGAYEKLLPEFVRTTGVAVKTGSGSSQGDGPQTIAAQLARGAVADVVILSREGLDDLIAAKRIVQGSDVNLAKVGLGVAVRPGAAKPDVRTIEGFKQTLLGARAISVPGSTSGIWLTTVLFPRLGIADKLNVTLSPRGSDAAAALADGKVDLLILPVSEILHAHGVELVSGVAPEAEFMQTFSTAIVAGSTQAAEAKRLIDFLASAQAADAIKKSGMDLPR